MLVTRFVGKVLDAVRGLRLWQRVIVAYLIAVPVCWLVWEWGIPERRLGSREMFALLIGPIIVALLVCVGFLIGRAFDGDD